jgi:hypothetical protein
VIDFRYHLVSIVAIFLALAVGIVLGSSVLGEELVKSADVISADLQRRNDGLRAEKQVLQQQQSGNDSFVASVTPKLVQSTLAGERVVLVEAPGTLDAQREAVEQVLVQSGAVVSGRVVLTEKYFDPAQAGFLDALATQLKPVGVVFPESASPYDKAATVLASAIVTKDRAQLTRDDPAAATALDAYVEGGLVTVTDEPAKRASLAVLVAPAERFEGEGAAERLKALLALAVGLDANGQGTVVAGGTATAESGGLLAAVRDSGDAAAAVSTVDTVDMPAGLVIVVYALREQLAGRSDQYGIGPGASAFAPAAEATPTPTASSGE